MTASGHQITGRAWVFGENVNTDAMYPGYAMKMDVAEAAQHVFYDLRPGWAREVSAGDVLVGGRNFGIGSSRPVATLLRHLGIAAILAEEFNSLFMRNAINNGLPAITLPGACEHLRDGEPISLDLDNATLTAGERTLQFAPLPDFLLQIIDAGGLIPRLIADGYLPQRAKAG
jgi:3-isopropylmalate/(R)-2-methylmalate dehydratase small subunit